MAQSDFVLDPQSNFTGRAAGFWRNAPHFWGWILHKPWCSL